MDRRIARVVFGASLLYVAAAVAAGPAYVTQWGGSGIGPEILHDPAAVAVDDAGNVYVVDRGHDQIVKFDGGGSELARWGSAGSGPGQFDWPVGIAVDAFGDLDVVDTGNDRIEQFDPTGIFLREWGGFGAGPGQFDHPLGIAADPAGDIFVSDTGNDRIEVFDIAGGFSRAFGGSGTGAGQFDQPIGIAIDTSNSTLYVVDAGNHRVEHFDEGGGFGDAWGTFGDGPGTFRNPNGIAMDGNGTLYVTDHDDDRIEQFTRLGTFLGMFGSFGLGDAELVGPEGIAATAQGLVYVADARNDRIEEFAAASVTPPPPPALLTAWGSEGTGSGQFELAGAVATDRSSGTLLVVDDANDRIERFDANGSFLGEFAVPNLQVGASPKILDRLIAADGSSGAIYIYNEGKESTVGGIVITKRIERYAADGTPLGQFGSFGTDTGQFAEVVALALDSSANVYLVDPVVQRIIVFSSTGTFLRQWDVTGGVVGGLAIDSSDRVNLLIRTTLGSVAVRRFATDGTFLDEVGLQSSSSSLLSAPNLLTIDGAGDLLMPDPTQLVDPSSIAVYTRNGERVTSFVGGLPCNVMPPAPMGCGAESFAVDSTGDVYVSHGFAFRVEKYAPPPTLAAMPPSFVRAWGTLAGIGAFQGPGPAALSPSGDLYVANQADPRLVIDYAPDGTVITAFGGSGTGPGQFREPVDLAVALSGDVYVTDFPDRIEQFTAGGSFRRQWLAFGDGDPSSGVSSVAGIAVDDGGNVFVVNAGTLRVEEFDATGTPITRWSIQTTDAFDACPDGLAFDPSSGDLWLVDHCLFLVQEYRTDGTFVSQFGSMGSAPGQFLDIERIAADGAGHLFVPDAGNDRIDEFDTHGNLISEWGTFGVMPGQVDEPRGIGATPDGRIYVVEESGARVQVFQGAATTGDHLVLTAPATAAAGVPFTITVTAEAAAGQPLAAYRGTVHFTSSDAAAGMPADYTFRKSDRGTHEFQVTLDTVNGAGTQTIEVMGSQLPQGDASAPVALFASDAGASVMVDAGASVATARPPTPGPGQPLVVTLTTPQGGRVSFTSTSGGPPPTGFSALGVGMVITAPSGTTSQPLQLVLALDASILPAGTPPASVAVFRDGMAIADCAVPGGSDASPDPCVESRALAGSVLTLTVLTSHASTWSVAVPCADCDSHDLAVTKIGAPKIVTLTVKKPALTGIVTVRIQNRSPDVETFSDSTVLANLVHLTVQSLGSCASPEPVLHLAKKPTKFPVTLKSKATLSVPFDVAFECANDPVKGAGHEDYSFMARVDHTGLGGGDAHVLDDVCPRSVPAGGGVDPFPDGTLIDKGCGTKKPDKTFGAPVLTDVSAK